MALDYDVSGSDPDGSLSDIPETNGSKTGRDRMLASAREPGATVGTLAARAGSCAGLAFVGTAASIADEMETWGSSAVPVSP